MINVATYGVYVQLQDGQFQVLGDANSSNSNTITVSEPAAVINVTAIGLSFADPPISAASGSLPSWLASGLVQNDNMPPTIAIHDINIGLDPSQGSATFTVNLQDPSGNPLPPLPQLTVQNVSPNAAD